MTRAARVWLGLAAVTTVVGLVYGILQDIWGWWWLSVALGVVGLWLIRRDPGSQHRLLAKRALVGIGAVLAVLAAGALAFVVWFSSFEF